MIGIGLGIGIGVGLSSVPSSTVQVVQPGSSNGLSTTAASAFHPYQLTWSLDLNGDIGVTGSAGTLAWTDQSGNGNNASANTGSTGLTVSASDSNFNNHGSVTCNGTTDAIKADGIGALIAGNPGTVFYLLMVHRYVSLAAGQVTRCAWSNTASNAKSYQINKNTSGGGHTTILNRTNDAAGSTQLTGAAFNSTAAHVWDIACDGTNGVGKMDGAADVASAAMGTGQLTPNQFTFGARRLNSATVASLFSNTAWARLMISTTVPGASDQTLLRTYMKLLYGTP